MANKTQKKQERNEEPDKTGIMQEIMIKLPRPFGMSHIENITYCLDELQSYSRKLGRNDLVIGYRVEVTSLGSREQLHRILPYDKASNFKEELRRKNRVYEYRTVEDLTTKLKEIEKGRYKVDNGLIVSLNPSYPGNDKLFVMGNKKVHAE